MLIESYDHKDAGNIIPEKLYTEVIEGLNEIDFKAELYKTASLRKEILGKLTFRGWSSEIRVSEQARITITSKNGNVGLCLQIGNMARFYADLLKLETMYENGQIDSAIYITLLQEDSRLMGSNLANFTRLSNELENIFNKVIKIPLLIIGVGDGK